MSTFLGCVLFLVALYMVYRDTEERHYKSLRENSELLYKAQKELSDFKENYYTIKDELILLEKELDKCKKSKQKNSATESKNNSGDELAQW
jgi:hypothetical protein